MSASLAEFDLAIIGGGPGGSSAAITAARLGIRVLLLESGTFPRHKVCGEFVSAESLGVLSELLKGSSRAKAILRDAQAIDRTRLLLGERVVEAPVSPAALSLSRYQLDALLWEAAKEAGVDVRADCEVTEISGDGPFCVRTRDAEFTARTLIVAAGRWSRFVSDRTTPPGPKWLGVKAHFRERRSPRSTDLYFFENGYCGVQPIGRGLVNACAMVRADRATSLEEVFRLHPRLADRTTDWQTVTAPVSTAPLIYREPQPVRGNVLFVGDAAGFIDPFVGDGISIALRSGAAASQCLQQAIGALASLPQAAVAYSSIYAEQFAPLLSAASRVRSLMSMPGFAQAVVFEALRLPGVIPLMMRKTRRAS
jgi:flavin-dependent dehydrogenase